MKKEIDYQVHQGSRLRSYPRQSRDLRKTRSTLISHICTMSNDKTQNDLKIFWPDEFTVLQKELVVHAAHWSRLAYKVAVTKPEDVIHLTDFSIRPITNLERFECPKTDAFCIIFNSDEKSLVVATRGTSSAEDVLCDLELEQTVFAPERSDVLVHSGFHAQFIDLKAAIDTRVLAHLEAGGHLICTGHSLGAAVASIMTLAYALRFPKHVSFIGLGTPRPGNDAFAILMKQFSTTAYCVKNKRDPVCALVPSLWYAQVGQEICIGHDEFPNIPDPLYWGDHRISEYIQNLTIIQCLIY